MKKLVIVLAPIFFLMSSFQLNAQTVEDIVKEAADQAAYALQIEISPLFGKGSSSSVIDYDFNTYREELTLDFEARWYGKATIFDDYELFKIRGVLKVDSRGNMSYEPYWNNSAIDAALGSQLLMEVLASAME